MLKAFTNMHLFSGGISSRKKVKPYARLKRMQSVSQIVDAEHRIIFSLIVFIKEWKARAHFVFFRNCCFLQQTKFANIAVAGSIIICERNHKCQ